MGLIKNSTKTHLESCCQFVIEEVYTKFKEVGNQLEQDQKIKMLEEYIESCSECQKYITLWFIRRLLTGSKLSFGLITAPEEYELSIHMPSLFYALDFADNPWMKLQFPRVVYRMYKESMLLFHKAANKINIFGIRKEQLQEIYDKYPTVDPWDGPLYESSVEKNTANKWPKKLIKAVGEDKWFLKIDGNVSGTWSAPVMKIFEYTAQKHECFVALGFESPRKIEMYICTNNISVVELVIKKEQAARFAIPKQLKYLVKCSNEVKHSCMMLKDMQYTPNVGTCKIIHVNDEMEFAKKAFEGDYIIVEGDDIRKERLSANKEDDFIVDYRLGVQRYFLTQNGHRINFSDYLSKIDIKTLGSMIGQPIVVVKYAGKKFARKKGYFIGC